jgi:hypothetical protein
VSEGNNQTTDEPRASEKNKKSLKNPLTNPHRMWYNDSVLKRGTQTTGEATSVIKAERKLTYEE